MSVRPRVSVIVLTLAGWLAVAAVHAGDWPRFRGPNGDGASDDKNIPVKWTKDDILWKTPLPGIGHSSPIVWGDRLFLQTSSKDGKERQLLCLDVKNGAVLWAKSAPGSMGKTHLRSSLASGTPATDGERVYVIFWDGKNLGLYAYDFKGELLWERPLGAFVSQHGAGHSPIVWRDRVILADDQDGSSVLLAFDSKTGKEAWRAERKPFRACYSTPLIRETAKGPELLVASTAGVTSYDPASGKENWEFNWKFDGMALRTVASPVVAGNIILATSGDGNGSRHAVAVKLDGKGDVSGTNLVWENRKTLPYVPSPLARGEHVYTVNDKGTAACHEALTGKEIWSKSLGSDMTASPVMIDGKIYAVGEDGEVFVFEASPVYKLLARNSLGESVSASPAIAAGRVFIRGKQNLYCIGKATK
jgi:outer membrane protein assembly factor BamB